MSGGVDSSMTAQLLKEAGYEVEGLSLVLFETRGRKSPTACCTLEALDDAAATARSIGIPHATLGVRDEFISKVVEPFIESYQRGLTPNPCILCNQYIKFPFLMEVAKTRGAEFIATGHYARVERSGGAALLKKGIDEKKDQSYVLYVLTHEILNALLLPLGEHTKDEIRQRARAMGLPAADREESQEICFVEDRDYPRFISTVTGKEETPGDIVDAEGQVVGTHRGIHRYTLGQRKGLGISSPAPLYVTGIDAESNTVRVGAKEDATSREFLVGSLNWLVPQDGEFRADVKVRSTMQAKPALIKPIADGQVRVAFDEPQWAPAPGQAAVFYEGETVVGGGVIEP